MIIIIDNYDSFTYNLYQLVASFNYPVEIYRNDQITIDAIKTKDPLGIILSPGPGHPSDAGICIDLIRSLINESSTIPLLGVCLGHQAIVAALGGNIITARNILHGKKDAIFHEQEGLYQTLSQPFIAGRYHSLIAERETLPASLLINAETKNGDIMGICHTRLPIHGVQFHPESILTSEGYKFIQSFILLCTKMVRE